MTGARDDTRLRLSEVLGSLSLGADLGAGVGDEAALRTAIAVTHLSRALGCEPSVASDAYYAAVLRYLGCTSFAHEEARVSAGDELAMLATFEAADSAKLREVLAAAISGLARDAPPLERAKALAGFLLDPAGYAKLATAHCSQAAALSRDLGMSEGVTRALDESYERWDGRGAPKGLRGNALSLASRLLHVANALEVQHRVGGREAALEVLRARRGGQLEPALVDALEPLAPELFAALESGDAFTIFLALEPTPLRTAAPTALRSIALGFARYVDLKSTFTLGHSTGVASLVERAAPKLGLDAATTERAVIAALLHDLGRASVPNGIWDKPGALSTAERERVRLHAYHGERILRRSALLAPFAELAALHHERLDGSGYPHQSAAAAQSVAARLLQAADVCHALLEDRPWRAALDAEAATRVLAAEVDAGRLDRAACSAVLEAAGAVALDAKRRDYPDGLSEREVEVLIWLARGATNQAIGKRLFVSPKTVKNHVAHIYAKIGVSTRAAAALYAVTHALLTTGGRR